MSVIEKASRLNLMGKVAIVTSAATPLGAQTCRTLLRHNCLVLGLDSNPIPESERLFSALGTHFQTLQLDLGDDGVVEQVVEHSRERFWKQGFDAFISFDRDDGNGLEKLKDKISKVMGEEDGGVLLNVVSGRGKENFNNAVLKASAKGGEAKKVRSNVVLLDETSRSGPYKLISAPPDSVKEVHECVKDFHNLGKGAADEVARNKGIANLLLFLSTSMARDIDSAAVSVDGGWKSL